MSAASLVGLIGFFIGIVLHLFLLSVVLKRRWKNSLKRSLLFLLSGLLTWYSGNFVAMLLRQMNVQKVALLLEIVDAIAFTGLSVLPALLLHTHWNYYSKLFSARKVERLAIRALLIILYGQLLLLPVALAELFKHPEVHPLQKLGIFEAPFLVLLALSYFSSCYLQVNIAKNSREPVEREVFQRLIPLFILIPIFTFWVFLIQGREATVIDQLWVNLALLASLLPTFVVAYYIYRHQFLQLTVHRNLASAFLVLLVLLAYLAGIRSFGRYLAQELGAPTLLLEATFLVTLLLFFPPLSQWLQTWVSRSVTAEIDEFRALAGTIERSSLTVLSAGPLQEIIEGSLQTEWPGRSHKLHLGDSIPTEHKPKPSSKVYPVRSGNHSFGYLEVDFEGDEGPGQREGYRLLANAIGTALERLFHLEHQFEMERQLAERNRLAELGRMAASVAHNVKNPLSSIKTLLQLQVEAENLTDEQRMEFKMMVEEIDRLSSTISNLLRFSRLDQNSSQELPCSQVHLPHFLGTLRGVFGGDLKAKNLKLEISVSRDLSTLETNPEALKDILSNLLTNAIEASPEHGTIHVGLTRQGMERVLFVDDQGPGIPKKLGKKVVDPFFTTKGTGTGLGLAIVKHQAEQIGGRLELISPFKNGGTRAAVVLPG